MAPRNPHSPLRRGRAARVCTLVVALLATVLGSASPLTAAPAATTSKLVRVDPTRVLDTRTGVGAPAGPLSPGGSLDLDPSGALPSGAGTVTAVVLNVTATDSTGPGFVQVFPTGTGLAGTSSNLNIERAGQTIANLVVAPVGTGGKVTIYSQGGGHVLADVFGYFVDAASSTDGRYVPVSPSRLLDTRTQPAGRLAANGSVALTVRGVAGVQIGRAHV